MTNNTNTVTILINRSNVPALRAGKMIPFAPENDDLLPGDGKLKVEAIVVKGNKQYPNGKKLTLWLYPNLPA